MNIYVILFIIWIVSLLIWVIAIFIKNTLMKKIIGYPAIILEFISGLCIASAY